MNRATSISEVEGKTFDLCIIGGGITGAGLLLEAAKRGCKAVLLEKGDFASGTSSKSSKIIHGGLRYLKYMQFRLVYEALHERKQLLKRYPHLVKPLPFLIPSFNSARNELSKRLLLFLYDALAGKKVIRKHAAINADAILQKVPAFASHPPKTGLLYWEAVTNDAQLTMEVIAEAVSRGQFAFNYMEAAACESSDNKITSLCCVDKLDGRTLMIQAKLFVNATGAWTDQLLALFHGRDPLKMQPAKGVHVVIHSERLKSEYALILESLNSDKRYLYAIPWQDNLTLLGATDTEYKSSPDEVQADEEDVMYILSTVNAYFPSVNLSQKDILSVFAGLRPLLAGKEIRGSYHRTREYEIWWSKENLINIAGGKFTSFLSMSRNCLDAATAKFPALKKNLSQNHVDYKGSNNADIAGGLKYINEGNNNIRLVSEGISLEENEIIFFVRFLVAVQVEDILTRRTTVTYRMKVFDGSFVRSVAVIMAKELNKEATWADQQVSAYYQHWLKYHPAFLNT
jgi:glycerol-3-phosphate dehydrogenase